MGAVMFAAVLLIATFTGSVNSRTLHQTMGGSTTLNIDWVSDLAPAAALPSPRCRLFSPGPLAAVLAAAGPGLR